MTPIALPIEPDPRTTAIVAEQVERTGFALYRLQSAGGGAPGAQAAERAVSALCRALRMVTPRTTVFGPDDALTRIENDTTRRRGGYVPYSNRAVGWHTDGYYASRAPVRSFVLHCVRPAASGGTSYLLDPRVVHARLRSVDPGLAIALSRPVLHVPANRDGTTLLREAVTVPVFEHEDDGALLMRYSRRKRHLRWIDDGQDSRYPVATAVAALDAIIDAARDHIFRHRLQPGEGLVCNNVLHGREAFVDDAAAPRLLLRGRFAERICCEPAQRLATGRLEPDRSADDRPGTNQRHACEDRIDGRGSC